MTLRTWHSHRGHSGTLGGYSHERMLGGSTVVSTVAQLDVVATITSRQD